MKKIAVIAGVRPQFIKCASFQKQISKFVDAHKTDFSIQYINASQHYDFNLAGVFLKELNLNFDFTVKQTGASSFECFVQMVSQIGDFLKQKDNFPDWVVVFGDANSALAGALIAKLIGAKLAHFEAGAVISEDQTPEVINSKIISQIAELNLCVSDSAAANLRANGIKRNIHVVGDIARHIINESVKRISNSELINGSRGYIILALHHPENLTPVSNLKNVLETLGTIPEKVIFIVHPKTEEIINKNGLKIPDNFTKKPPLSYFDMLELMYFSSFIICDSGGLQRESYYLRKRCLVRAIVTFWPDFTNAGIHKSIGGGKKDILDGISWMREHLNDPYPVLLDFEKEDVGVSSLKLLLNLKPN